MGELAMKLFAGTLIIVVWLLIIKTVFELYKEFRDRKQQKELLQYSRERLHGLALKFRDDCIAETKEFVAQYTTAISMKSYRRSDHAYRFFLEYCKTIKSLEKEYWIDYALKYSEGDNRLRCEAEDLPNYILVEYKAELSKIADIFHDMSKYMQQQMEEQEKHWEELFLEEYKEKYN